MQFDPAVAAQQAFAKVRTSAELGDELAAAVAASNSSRLAFVIEAMYAKNR